MLKKLERVFLQQALEGSKIVDTESVLSNIAEHYMETTLKEEREVMKPLNYIGLDKKQWEIIDEALLLGNKKNYLLL